MPKGVHNSLRGPKSAYDPAICPKITSLCLLGCTDERIAELLDISNDNLIKWRKAHPELQQAFDDGRDHADAAVAKALYHRALGYSHAAEKIHITKDGDVIRVPYVQHYPPDTPSLMFYLSNRARAQWKRDPETSISINMSLEQLVLEAIKTREEDAQKTLEHQAADPEPTTDESS